eukprot:GFYU01019329.1.p1 GENE.GFYU01019329.1~~GFYU01019329.1.p1  ORF type:complete len:392 (+),score=94.49 GFYU01019329.1:239-1414(+)
MSSGNRVSVVNSSSTFNINERRSIQSTLTTNEVTITPLRRAVLSLLYIILWYVSSISLTLYNKWMLSYWVADAPECTGSVKEMPESCTFHYPFGSTAFHMAVKCVTAALILYATKKFDLSMLTWEYFFKFAFPVGCSTALDVGLSNLAIRMSSVSFYTLIKPSTLVFVLGCGIMLGIEKPTRQLLVIVLTIFAGVALASYGEVEFDAVAFILIMVASMLSGLRWALTQVMLQGTDREIKLTPLQTLFIISPGSVVALLPVVGVWEAQSFVESPFAEGDVFGGTIALVAVGGLLAMVLILAELKLVELTSSLSLSIAGIFKEVLTIAFGVMVFADNFTFLNGVGMVVTMIGIVSYNVYRYKQTHRPTSQPYSQLGTMLEEEGDIYEMCELED